MINVTVRSIMKITKALGGHNKLALELPDECDVLDLLMLLSDEYGDEFRDLIFIDGEYESRNIIIMINGRSILAYDGIYCRIKDGDEVLIMPVASGG